MAQELLNYVETAGLDLATMLGEIKPSVHKNRHDKVATLDCNQALHYIVQKKLQFGGETRQRLLAKLRQSRGK